MRFACLPILFLVAAISSAHATIVNISSAPNGRTAVDASLTALDDGDQFLIGKFSNPGALSLSQGSAASILAAGGWSQFDGGQTISHFQANPGKVQGTVTDNTAAATAFDQQNLYLVIFNTSSAATASQMGIFRAASSTGSSNPWVFPTNGGGLGDSITISSDEPSMAAIGGVGSTTEVPQRFILAVLPEPSAAGLVVLGILSLLGYRRIRRLR
jgi:hypothetical protein